MALAAVQQLHASLLAKIVDGLKAPAALRIEGVPEPAWINGPLFKHLYQIRGEVDSEGNGEGEGSPSSCATLLPAATLLADASKIVSTAMVQKLCKVLSSSEETLVHRNLFTATVFILCCG
jgi:hypothetical protein